MASKAPKYDAKSTDPPLLEKYSTIKSYTTSSATYDKLRIFYRKHPQTDNLPKEPPLPLLVFIHGLGGSVAQFTRLLTSLTQNASCLAVDLPGCGYSEYTQTEWGAYTTDALVELLEVIINDHREEGQRVVLVAHSMGCAFAALLANPRTTIKTDLHEHVLGVVAMCPPTIPSEHTVKSFRPLLWIPDFLFNIWRAWDRRGGINSASITRFVGSKAKPEARKLQLIFNHQSRTPVFRRMAWGALPTYENGVPKGGMPENSIWAGLQTPVLLICGGLDGVTPPRSAVVIYNLIKETHTFYHDYDVSPQAEAPLASPLKLDAVESPVVVGDDVLSVASTSPSSSPPSSPRLAFKKLNDVEIPDLPLHPPRYVDYYEIQWAGHGLHFTEAVVPGLISDFLSKYITRRLSLGWQLQYLTRDGKWDVKNLKKWESVEPVSESIGGIFRAIKTLRQTDEKHSPVKFTMNYGDVIKDVVDISHDTPVYNPEDLVGAGVRYHKVATVSKIPPPREEIDRFIETVDGIREERRKEGKEFEIGVHCHYGFNRTGFLIVCYLVEREGWTVEGAMRHFAEARPKGIKHEHFKDRLHVMYAERDAKY
ncbi:Alpha/Beta hydrolase protein [Triangularia verruculosa]|uniref:Alpha/Beta hydrolase protein n=1 Tax=Triangularia verruculosa TaxID=2587418 RepID=A0AAN7AYM5_9PEZI|nr:Alpha/Beta hydrolase protein [Triangularia verruculosa]